jgi:hypothetical protein
VQQQQQQGSKNLNQNVSVAQGSQSWQGQAGNPCPPLSKALLDKYARNNTVLITFVGLEMFRIFGRTWLGNVRVGLYQMRL